MADQDTTDKPSSDAPAPTPPPRLPQRPLDWYREKGTKWSIACLAARVAGWPSDCDDDFEIGETDYDAGIEAAKQKLDEVRMANSGPGGLADSTAARRAFILTHPSEMDAVVAYKPGMADAQALMERYFADDAPNVSKHRRDVAFAHTWEHVLYPADKSPERARLMDEQAIAFLNYYPLAYMQAIGLNMADVRKKR